MVTLPKNIPHAWGNRTTAKLRMAFIVYPGGAEDALRIIAKGEVVDLPAIGREGRCDRPRSHAVLKWRRRFSLHANSFVQEISP